MLPDCKCKMRFPKLPRRILFLLSFTLNVFLISINFKKEPTTKPQINIKAKLFPCNDKIPQTFYALRGKYFVLYNYFTAEKSFRCDESITYTTHGEWTYFDNLLPLLKRWQGPVSFAVYCPGRDFRSAFMTIQYLRECIGNDSTNVKDLVTFHLIFDHDHFPPQSYIPIPHDPGRMTVNCGEIEKEIRKLDPRKRQRLKSSYPVNLLRNVAKDSALTHFVLPSDVELYPSRNIITSFLEMIGNQNESLASNSKKRVFVLPIFEVEKNITNLPETKLQLVKMLERGMAIPFHKFICPACHTLPKVNDWVNMTRGVGLNVFHVAKRMDEFKYWEPIYIGSNDEPLYDERLGWEGKSDKMAQAFQLCLLDYEFHILDNAFLVHRQGIKREKYMTRAMFLQRKLVLDRITPELEQLYGNRSEHGRDM